MSSVPVPESPTYRPWVMVHFDPLPSTVAVPLELLRPPTEFPELDIWPPFWIFSVPVPRYPTYRAPEVVHFAPAPFTVTVPLELL